MVPQNRVAEAVGALAESGEMLLFSLPAVGAGAAQPIVPSVVLTLAQHLIPRQKPHQLLPSPP